MSLYCQFVMRQVFRILSERQALNIMRMTSLGYEPHYVHTETLAIRWRSTLWRLSHSFAPFIIVLSQSLYCSIHHCDEIALGLIEFRFTWSSWVHCSSAIPLEFQELLISLPRRLFAKFHFNHTGNSLTTHRISNHVIVALCSPFWTGQQ